MAGGTKNLGQVAGLFIGTTPPDNTSLIWYDSTPSMQCHKVYSVTLGQWVVLDDNTILAVEYSVLRGRAQDPGLSVGQWFKITDKDNALALAITSTKVQYVDSIGNILIDDLSASIQYHVTHQNLLIDDVHGVFDTVNKRLVFQFSEVSAVNFLGDDYFLGERKVDNVWSLFKIKLSKLLSTTSGNTITWDNGFYLNFTSRFTALLDVTGGAVSKSTFDNTIASIRTDLTNVASNQQAVADQAAAAVGAAVTDDMIFSKRLPDAPDVSTGPADILEGDTLQMIVNKAQRWFNSLKWATGIGLSDDYAEATTDFNVNNNDSVETAIAKLAGHVRALQTGSDNGTDNVIVSPGYNDAPTSDNGATAGSVLTRLLEKLRYYSLKHEDTNGITLHSSYTEQAHTLVPGVTNLTDVLEQLAFKISRNIQPIYSLIPWYQQPIYDNVIQYAGYGWFPCGYIYAGTLEQCNDERNKWVAKYSQYGISVTVQQNTDADSVVYKPYRVFISYIEVDGNRRFVPNLQGRMLRCIDPAHNYGIESVNSSGGNMSVSIEANHLPSHTHDVSSDGNHNHGGTITGGNHSHKGVYKSYQNSDRNYGWPFISQSSADGSHDVPWGDGPTGGHSHTISESGNHTHSVTGGSTTHDKLNVMNPYVTCAFLIRLL